MSFQTLPDEDLVLKLQPVLYPVNRAGSGVKSLLYEKKMIKAEAMNYLRSLMNKSITCVIVFGLLLLLTACKEKTPLEITPTPSPEVVVKAWTAEIVGELMNVAGCIRIQNSDSDYALVWTPDVSATIEGDSLRVITGIMRGSQTEVLLHFGDTIRLSGGETTQPDEDLPPNCQGPYWVVGFEIGPVQPAEE